MLCFEFGPHMYGAILFPIESNKDLMRIYKFAEVQAIGAGAVNQAVKAIAKVYLQGDGIDIICIIQSIQINSDGQERNAIHFAVEPRPR